MTSPFPFVADAILAASDLNSIGASTAWTPSFSYGVTIGDGTVTGTYLQVNDLIIAEANFVFGSTSAVSTFVRAVLPVQGVDAFEIATGTRGLSQDTSTGETFPLMGRTYDTAAVYLYAINAGGTYAVGSSSQPFTWVTGDVLQWTTVYMAA